MISAPRGGNADREESQAHEKKMDIRPVRAVPDGVFGRAEMLGGALLSVLLAAMPPVAELVVRKWFM